MKVDLHIHTNSSDGTFDPEDVIRETKENGIGLFSVCDHDSCENSYKLFLEKDKLEATFVMGAEISCTEGGREFHITSYAFDPEDPGLNELLKSQMQLRYDNNDRTIRYLENKIDNISFIEYESYTYDPKRGGWKPLNYLIDKKIITGLPDYFSFVKGCYKKPEFFDSVSVINCVKHAGGFPFLAHPSYYNGGGQMPESELGNWVDKGICGIECYSPYCTPEESAFYVGFCKENDLQISGGSDCHGHFLPRPMGVPEVTLDMLKLDFI